MIKREQYMSKIRPFYDSDLIKVITGIRRCGKSVILDEIRKEIEIKSNNTIFLNLEHIYDIDKVPIFDSCAKLHQEHLTQNAIIF